MYLKLYHVQKCTTFGYVNFYVIRVKILSNVKKLDCSVVIASLDFLNTLLEVFLTPSCLLIMPNPA